MRKFIHIDMDCFYAAVEMRDHPQWRDVPIAVGGAADKRGVIATCNYPARAFGVRSAMSTAHALRLCPDLVLVSGRMALYRQIGLQIRDIMTRYTPKIEPLSLDEAYLDVSDCQQHQGSATRIAQALRAEIFKETGLTASAGVAPIKFVAKIASDENKPNGLFVVTPEQLDSFVLQLPLQKIPGVGPATLAKLHNLGLFSCADIRQFPHARLVRALGKFGSVLWRRAHAIDEREVQVDRVRKSVGVERTVSEDLVSRAECEEMVGVLYEKLYTRLVNATGGVKIKSQGMKMKFHDFQSTTIEHRQDQLDKGYFYTLLDEILERKAGRAIRLVGLHVTLREADDISQLDLPLHNPATR